MPSFLSNPLVDVALGGVTYVSVLAIVLTYLYQKVLKEKTGEIAQKIETLYSDKKTSVLGALETLEEYYSEVKDIAADSKISEDEVESFISLAKELKGKVVK